MLVGLFITTVNIFLEKRVMISGAVGLTERHILFYNQTIFIFFID
jgi:hypothetical protein